MPCTFFEPCPSEINTNSGFTREHVESCSSTTINIISAPPQCLCPPKWTHTHKVAWPFDNVVLRDHVTNLKHISTTKVFVGTKHCRMITCCDGLLLIKSHVTLITWYWEIKCQTETIISSLPQSLWSLNLGGQWITLEDF